jgi:hypothetical protein
VGNNTVGVVKDTRGPGVIPLNSGPPRPEEARGPVRSFVRSGTPQAQGCVLQSVKGRPIQPRLPKAPEKA